MESNGGILKAASLLDRHYLNIIPVSLFENEDANQSHVTEYSLVNMRQV